MGNWNTDEIEALKQAYVENDIPSDSLVMDKDALDAFTHKFNERIASIKVFDSEEIADRLLKLRKNKKLPRIRT